MVLQVEVLEGKGRGLVHAEPIVVDDGEQGPVSKRADSSEKALKLVLGEVFREAVSHGVHSWTECGAPAFDRLTVKVPAGQVEIFLIELT